MFKGNIWPVAIVAAAIVGFLFVLNLADTNGAKWPWSPETYNSATTTKSSAPDAQLNVRLNTLGSAVSATDAYLIQNVGSEYFHNSYRRVTEKDSISKDKTQYIIWYNYLPATELSGNPIEISIAYYPLTKVTHPYFGVYNCIQDPSLCKFSVTKDQAIILAKQHGLEDGTITQSKISLSLLDSALIPRKSLPPGWYWLVRNTSTINSECFNVKIIAVHASDGAALSLPDEMGCQ